MRERRLVRFISREEIAAAVNCLAQELDRDYRDTPPVMVGILKGAFIFLADLVRQMKAPIRSIEFVHVSSYGPGTTSSGRARITVALPREKVAGQHMVVVEDIVDTGLTTAAVIRYLKRHKPASIRLCALLDKPSRRQVPVAIDYLGLTVPDRFVVGYGLDVDQRYRQLPEIRALEE